MDPRKSNGGVFLGLNGIVIKSHGGTDAEGFAAAIDMGYDMVRYELLAKIGEIMAQRRARERGGARWRAEQARDHVAFGRARLRQLSARRASSAMTNSRASVDTTDEWIVQRTGIRERHIAARRRADLRSRASTRRAPRSPMPMSRRSAIDLIVLATSTPDQTFPATAVSVQAGLGITHGAAFDLQAVCSGFVYALAVADGLLQGRRLQARAGDRGGDLLAHPRLERPHHLRAVRRRRRRRGAGGAAASRRRASDRGILTTHLRSDGRHKAKLYVDGGPSSTQTVGHLRMEGREVFKHAVAMITDVIEDAFKATGYSAADIDWFVPHQANKRIIDGSAHKLGIAPEKVVITVDRHGNTSAASIPLALADAVADRRIKRGDLVLLEAMGGGFTWGSALLRW